MCTGDFKLYPLGLNRAVPNNFFQGDDSAGAAANFSIGVDHGTMVKMVNKHNENVEVVPDAYKLSINFKSCLANNLNTSIFQYYVQMTGYENYTTG